MPPEGDALQREAAVNVADSLTCSKDVVSHLRGRLRDQVVPAVRTWMTANLHRSSQLKRVELALHADVPLVVISQLTSILVAWVKKNDVWTASMPLTAAWKELFGGSCPFPFQLRNSYDSMTGHRVVQTYEFEIDPRQALTVVQGSAGGLTVSLPVLGFIVERNERFLRFGGKSLDRKMAITQERVSADEQRERAIQSRGTLKSRVRS